MNLEDLNWVAISGMSGVFVTLLVFIWGNQGFLRWIESKKEKRTKRVDSDSKTRKLLSNLPALPSFVGRNKELNELDIAIQSRESVIVVEGTPGSGKTALALKIALEYFEEAEELLRQKQHNDVMFFGFIWIDARNRLLSLDSLLDYISIIFNSPGITSLNTIQKETECYRLLNQHGTLLVIDNFESIKQADAEKIIRFLLSLPSNCTSILTTRQNMTSKGMVIMLTNLNRSESIVLIRQIAQSQGLVQVVNSSDESLSSLYTVTGGSPLAIEWALGQVKNRGIPLNSIINNITRGTGSIFDTLFIESWTKLSRNSQLILITASLVKASISNDALRTSCGFAIEEFDQALGDVVELFLLEGSESFDRVHFRYKVHPLTNSFIRTHYNEFQKDITHIHERLIKYYIYFASSRNETLVSGDDSTDVIYSLDNILYLVAWCKHEQQNNLLIKLVDSVHDLLFSLGRFDERVLYSLDAAEACEKLNLRDRQAHFLNLAAGTLPLQRKYGESDQIINKALQIARDVNDITQEARILRTYALIKYRQGYFSEADDILSGTASLARRANDMHNLVDILSLGGVVNFYLGNYKKSFLLQEEMLDICEQIQWNRAKCYALKDLAELELVVGSIDKAASYLQEALTLASDYSDTRQKARIQMTIAKLAIRTRKPTKAQKHLYDASQTFERLGMLNEMEELKAISRFVNGKPSIFWKLFGSWIKSKPYYSLFPIGGD